MCPTPPIIQTRQDHRFGFTFMTLGFAVTPLVALVLGSVEAARVHKVVLARLARVEENGKYVKTDGSVQNGSLEDVLKFGTIVLLRVDWLLAQPEGYVLDRRQDLKPEATVPEDQAVELLRAGKVAALSYRWLEHHHPDPKGWHLRALRKFFEKDAHRRWTAIMIDYTSLPQKKQKDIQEKKEDAKREPADETTFRAGLYSMSSVYASPRVTVLQHKALPDDKPRTPYDKSGWCTFEQAVASLATAGGGAVYNLVSGRQVLQAGKYMSADVMHAWFHNPDCHFTGRGDADEVARMYRDLLEQVGSFDAVRRKKEVSADEMLTTKPSKLRRATLPFLALALFFIIVCHDRAPPLPVFSASLCVLVVFIIILKLTESPIFRGHIATLLSHHPMSKLEYELFWSIGTLCCLVPMFRLRATRIVPSGYAAPCE